MSGSDWNPMMQNLNNPIMRLGIIPSKVQPDWYAIRDAQANADDPLVAGDCYPGGSKEINHDIMPGDFSFGRRCVRNHAAPPGEPNELGVVSLAGVYHPQGGSMRALEDEFYAQGVVVTECRVSDPMGNPGAQDPDSGYAIVKAGTISVINNGPHAFYPGQFVAWRFPPLHPEDYVNDMRQRARGGTPPGQIKPELVPFDYTDSTLQFKAALAAIQTPKADHGIADMDFAEFFAPDGYSLNDAPQMSGAAETAAGLKYGLAAIVAGAVEHLIAIGAIEINEADAKNWKSASAGATTAATETKELFKQLEVFGTGTTTKFVDMTKAIFEKDNAVGTRLHKGDTDDARYKKLRETGSHFLSTFSHGAWFSKTSKIVAKPLGYAAPSDTLHLLLGHTIV
jgi:hypothetical protein